MHCLLPSDTRTAASCTPALDNLFEICVPARKLLRIPCAAAARAAAWQITCVRSSCARNFRISEFPNFRGKLLPRARQTHEMAETVWMPAAHGIKSLRLSRVFAVRACPRHTHGSQRGAGSGRHIRSLRASPSTFSSCVRTTRHPNGVVQSTVPHGTRQPLATETRSFGNWEIRKLRARLLRTLAIC